MFCGLLNGLVANGFFGKPISRQDIFGLGKSGDFHNKC